MKEIQLSQGKTALVADEDYDLLNQFKWFAFKNHDRDIFYAVAKFIDKNGNRKNVYMHRFILNIENPKIQVDHKDGNGLNNQRNNLRLATHGQNGANRSSARNSSSEYLGVAWYKKHKCWRTQIKSGGKVRHLGYFNSEIDAASAYNNAARKLHGEFANLNKL